MQESDPQISIFFNVTHVYICIYVISMVLFIKHMHQLSVLN